MDTFKDNIKCDNLIIKIDVEGYEKEVIDSVKFVFSQTENSMLIIELLEENYGFLICHKITNNLRMNNFENIYKINDDDSLSKVDSLMAVLIMCSCKGANAKKNIESFTRIN